MKKARFIVSALLVLLTMSLSAQNITVTGTIVEESTGAGIPFASVMVKGTMTGVSSNADGVYTISAPASGTLVFSAVGFATNETAINGRTSINAALATDTEFLEETVVVGYGSAKKISAITGSAATVNSKLLKNAPVASLGDALQGQIAGLQVWTSSGEPSAEVTMRIRGVNSINASTEPLYILDGTPVAASIFNVLNSNDIENITVMKDASATAIYGSRAANGIVFITTRKGVRSEKPSVSLRAQYGVSNMINNQIELMNSAEWFRFNEMMNPAFLDDPARAAQYDFALDHNINTNWLDYFFKRNAPTAQADVAVSGATEKTDYYLSLGGLMQEGNAPYSDMSRVTLLNKVNTQVTKWLKVGISLNLTYQDISTTGFSNADNRNNPYNPMFMSQQMFPWFSPYEHSFDEQGNIVWGDEKKMFPEQDPQMWNTLYLQEIQPGGENLVRLNGNLYEQITPVKGLTLKAVQALTGNDYRYSGKANPVGPFEEAGQAVERFSRYYQFTFSNTAEYVFSIADSHNFEILAGQESIISRSNAFGVISEGITDIRMDWLDDGTIPQLPSYSASETAINSYFARLGYNYSDKYLVDLSYRRDGSSLFGKNRRWANFYSVGARWNLMNEAFLQDVSWINTLSLKASNGTTGNAGISNYLSYGVVGGYKAPYNGNIAWGLGNPANDDLTWEVVNNLNVGVSMRLFNSLSVDVDFYNKITTDMLMEIPYSLTTGHSGGWGNVADMRNRGVDFELSYDVPLPRDFYLNIAANFNYNQNRILSLFDGRDSFEWANTGLKLEKGHEYGEFFAVRSAGVDPRDGMQMWYDADGNKTKHFSDDHAVFTGKSQFAPWAGGFNFNFGWKGLSVGAQFSWVLGKYMWNNDKYFLMNPNFALQSNQAKEMLNMWTTPGQVTDVPGYESSRQFDDTFLENASFLRLKNLQVSYSLPAKWMKQTGFLGGVSIFAIGRNLFTFTEYTGYDPESDSSLQLGRYPNSKQYTCGIELTF